MAVSSGHVADERAMTPVLVMNPYYSGVAIARSLAPRGVSVYGLYFDGHAPGRRSRHFAGEFVVPDAASDPDGLVVALLDLTRRLDCRPVIFPTRDVDVTFLRTHRNRLDASMIIHLAEEHAHELLADKGQLAALAKESGVKSPVTVEVTTEADVCRIAEQLEFPLVLKPMRAQDWRSDVGKRASQSRKAIIAADPETLQKEYRSVATVTPRVVVQEFIPGLDHQLVICGCYVGREGAAGGVFTARKLLQNPPSAGTGCLIGLDDVPEIVEPTFRILRSVRYFGIAEAEFKYDPRDGRYALIEINTRHWDQHELGALAGVDISWLAYQEAVGQSAKEMQFARPGATGTWVAEREFLELWLRRAFGTDRRRPISNVRPYRVRRPWLLGIMRISDPLPGLILMLRMAVDLFTRALRRLGLRGRESAVGLRAAPRSQQ